MGFFSFLMYSQLIEFLRNPFSNICVTNENSTIKSSRPEVFLRKDVLKICSRFTGEHPCRSVISIKLQRNFVEIALRHGCSTVNLLQIFRTLFPKNTSGRVLLSIDRNITDNTKKVINLGKVCRIKNGGLRNSSINWIFLLRLLI